MRDLDIRNELKTTQLKPFYDDEHSRVIEELSLCVGDARIDVAVVNGSLHGFEIKSELDTLLRLPNQINIYSKVFDYLTICAGPRHVESILEVVPDWCGILLASADHGSLSLLNVRLPTRNEHTDKLSIAQLLWKDETIKGLQLFGTTKGITSKPKRWLWEMLAEVAPHLELADYVRGALKSRANWRSEQRPFESGDCSPLFST